MVIATLVAATWFDCRYRRIPNWLTLGSVGVGLLQAAWRYELPPALAGMIIGGLLVGLPGLIRPGSVGMGDIKLLAALGAFIGPMAVLWVIGLASFFATAYFASVGALSRGRDERAGSPSIPLAPFVLAGQFTYLSSAAAPVAW